jgi:hypothetical protein
VDSVTGLAVLSSASPPNSHGTHSLLYWEKKGDEKDETGVEGGSGTTFIIVQYMLHYMFDTPSFSQRVPH